MLNKTNPDFPTTGTTKKRRQKIGPLLLLLVTSCCLFAFSPQETKAYLLIQYFEDFRGCPMRATYLIDDDTGLPVGGYPIIQRMPGPCSDPGPGIHLPTGDFPLYDESGEQLQDGDEGLAGMTLDETRALLREVADRYNSELE